MLPRVRKLEERFGDALLAVGVHAGKYVEERRTPSIGAACLRLGVHHPVVNDRQFRVWRSYAVQAWPTLAFVDPDGYLIARQAGEVPLEALERFVTELISGPAASGLVREPFALTLPPPEPATGPLRFPGKLLVAGDRLFVSDTGHDRVLELGLEGDRATVRRRFGTGEPGFLDGAPQEASFREPQGLALGKGALFVADRANHAIRRIDLRDGRVDTVAGTGELGGRLRPGPAREVALRSPWDLCLAGETLFVAMAGSHQIWKVDLAGGSLWPHAGSGAESIEDGPLASSTLAQPSGIVARDGRLWFADAESSSVRWADVSEDGRVGTLVGTGLFDFGDRDGTGDEVRLQHPLSLAWLDGRIVVADSYNGKLKLIEPVTRACATWDVQIQAGESAGRLSGPGRLSDAGRLSGTADGPDAPESSRSGRPFSEPGGVAVDGEVVYVADTGNHRIVTVDQGTGAGQVLEIVAG